MDLTLTREQAELGELAAEILSSGAADGPDLDVELWTTLARADLLGVVVPEEFGGLGLGVLEACELLRQFGRTLPAVPLLPVTIAAAAVGRFGGDELRKALLPELLNGGRFGTEAFSTSTAHRRLTAVESATGWRVSGQLASVAYARQAGWLVTPASGPDGVLVVVVPLDGEGITIADQRQADHRPAGEITLDDVPVREVLVAQPTWIEQFGTLATCAVQLGVAQRALELLTAYLPVRTQFGRPLSDFQAVGQRAADAYTDVWAQELTLKSAAWRFTTGQDAGPDAELDAGPDAGADTGHGTPPDATLDATIDATLDVHLAKLWAARAGQRVVADAVHLHGGTGADRSYPLHRYFLAQTALSAQFGGAGQQLDEIGLLLADAPAGEVV